MCVSSTTYIYDKSTVVTASNFGKLGMLMSPEAKNKHEGLFYCCIKKNDIKIISHFIVIHSRYKLDFITYLLGINSSDVPLFIIYQTMKE